jgi:formylglycine-generating enzyme required for sulfatase activity
VPFPAAHAVKFALVVLAALGSLTLPGCRQPSTSQPDDNTQETASAGKAAAQPKEITFDLGSGIKLEMVLIPAGEFRMGSPNSDKDAGDDERPQHRVRITKPFYLGKYVVTQDQWEAVMHNNPSGFKAPKNPVDSVSWDDCQRFCETLNKKIGTAQGKFQLPTEAQWEYACRAGSTTIYCCDDASLDKYAWHLANSHDRPNPVGQKKPNAWGLFDMHGNAGEWCQDFYSDKYYATSPTDDPAGPATGLNRVNRGGGWDRPSRYCRSAFRSYYGPGCRYNFLGFRVSLNPAEK